MEAAAANSKVVFLSTAARRGLMIGRQFTSVTLTSVPTATEGRLPEIRLRGLAAFRHQATGKHPPNTEYYPQCKLG